MTRVCSASRKIIKMTTSCQSHLRLRIWFEKCRFKLRPKLSNSCHWFHLAVIKFDVMKITHDAHNFE